MLLEIAERKKIQAQFRAAKEAAEDASRIKSDFLSVVSHELRTPLTSIVGFAKIIRNRLVKAIFPFTVLDSAKTRRAMDQITENIGVIVSEGERLTELINDLLDISKLDAGKVEFRMEPLSVATVIDQATAAVQALFSAKRLKLTKDLEPELPLVLADRDRVIQVLINLVSNAVKFTPHGEVSCRAAREFGAVRIEVVDTGIGIPIEQQGSIFEKFMQLGDTLTDKPKGTGLGLAICKQIVEAHGGRIWVRSEPGQGALFAFTLPLVSVARETRDEG